MKRTWLVCSLAVALVLAQARALRAQMTNNSYMSLTPAHFMFGSALSMFTYYTNPSWYLPYAQMSNLYYSPDGRVFYGTPYGYVTLYTNPSMGVAYTPTEGASLLGQQAVGMMMWWAWHKSAMWDEFMRRYAPYLDRRYLRAELPLYQAAFDTAIPLMLIRDYLRSLSALSAQYRSNRGWW